MSYFYTSDNKIVELHPTRLQNPLTHKEELKIDIKVSDKASGTIYCDLLTLEEELQQVRLYGTGIQRPEIVRIRKKIEDNYLSIDTISLDDNKSISKEVEALYHVFCRYISENEEKYKSQTEFYDIPVLEFSKLISESEYPSFSSTKCKERLKLLNYIKCNNNRNDYTIRNGKDTSKVIRFVKKSVDDQIDILNELDKADA